MAAAKGKDTVASLLAGENHGEESDAHESEGSAHAQRCESVKLVSYAEEMNSRFRHTMEDAHAVVDGFGGDKGTGFFGVYDGHGGRAIAEFLRTNLHDTVEKELHAKGSKSVEECLKSAFLLTGTYFRHLATAALSQPLRTWGHAHWFADIAANETKEQASGATAVVCIVRQSGASRYVYAANCGDARAVLCHNGAAVRLTRDHKADDPEEVNRIEAAGGFILRKRVMGVLAVARSFGDFTLKQYVTAEPFTTTTKLDGTSEFLIIACDGVWDVLEDQAAVDIVRQCAATDSKRKLAGKALVRASLASGSTDNVTAMVVWL